MNNVRITIALVGFFLVYGNHHLKAQNNTLEQHIIKTESLNSSQVKELFSSKISKSQFVMIGEQHGLKETSRFTNLIYNLSKPFGYNTLCIETDAVAAKHIHTIAKNKNAVEAAKKLNQTFPFSIPFYNNSNDYDVFTNLSKNNGTLWGIDQPFMTQFRLTFNYLYKTAKSKALKKELDIARTEAIASYDKAIANKDFRAPYIFKYSDLTHNKLIKLSENKHQKNILKQLKKTKEIYMYNFTNQSYLNNLERSKLMKENFLDYYKSATISNDTPKVIFKLGANHSARGRNNTNVFDVSNLVSELAIMNQSTSTHILFKGVKGQQTNANPFSPNNESSYDNTSTLPKEIQEYIKSHNQKYYIVDVTQLRANANLYSKQLQDWVFKFDVVVLVNDTEATNVF